MKTQISRDSHRPDRHYSSVRLQQGRMIVDADWNELADIGRQRLDDALDDAVRSGAPRDAGVRLFLSGSGLRLSPGRLYADGVPAVLDGTASGVLLTAQPDYPNAPPLLRPLTISTLSRPPITPASVAAPTADLAACSLGKMAKPVGPQELWPMPARWRSPSHSTARPTRSLVNIEPPCASAK